MRLRISFGSENGLNEARDSLDTRLAGIILFTNKQRNRSRLANLNVEFSASVSLIFLFLGQAQGKILKRLF